MRRLCAEALADEPSTLWTADLATACIERLGDGLWVQLLLGSRRSERREALRVIHHQLQSIFPSRSETIQSALATAQGERKAQGPSPFSRHLGSGRRSCARRSC